MKKNPYSPEVPCHRVIRSDAKIGGYYGNKHDPRKEEILRKEGIEVKDGIVKAEFIIL